MTAGQEKRSSNRSDILWMLFFGTLVVCLLAACSPKSSQTDENSSEAAGNRADSLQPGLTVYYMEGFWRNVNKMPTPEAFVKLGKPGKPITRIDHRFKKGNVFDSGRNRGVGVQMMGFIHLPRAGEWQFKVQSNDGIEVIIEETLVVSDPKWHSDRFSNPLGFHAEKPARYKILLRYFQRKGTATLEFYWKPPGEKEFTIIPEKAYWHKLNP